VPVGCVRIIFLIVDEFLDRNGKEGRCFPSINERQMPVTIQDGRRVRYVEVTLTYAGTCTLFISSAVDIIGVVKLRVYLAVRKMAQVVCRVVQEVR
jgi:hypothetical protein